MAKTASNERKAFREAHCFLVKAAKMLSNKPHPERAAVKRFADRFLEEMGAWNPEYFTDDAMQARRLLRRGGAFPVRSRGYRRPKLSAMDRVIAGEPQLETAGR